MSGAATLAAWSSLLVDSLVRSGVTSAVICPGSRSTPLTWAALQHAGLDSCSVIDERSAAYHALGQARITGRPSVVITTSGTAAANCLPAIVEASRSATPLLVLTADRAPQSQDGGAPQTIDQNKLFGDHVRGFFDLGLPDPSPDGLRAVQRKAVQAVARARWPVPGPVHVNAPARKPLEPPSGESTVSPSVTSMVADLIAIGPTVAYGPLQQPDPAALRTLAAGLASCTTGLLVCGPLAPDSALDPSTLVRLVTACGLLLVGEAASQLRLALPEPLRAHAFDAYDLAWQLPEMRERSTPDLVVQLGAVPVSSALGDFLRQHGAVPRHVIAPFDWPDALGRARTLVAAHPQHVLPALVDALEALPAPSPGVRARRESWLAVHRRAAAVVWTAVERALAGAAEVLTEASAVRATIDALPAGSLLALGNSLPIREVEAYCPARSHDVLVCSQRGACGIDGVLSGAAGAARQSHRPTTVLLGDVSFLHDLGGLWAARDLDSPFVVVVVNNHGGRIFEQLPIAELPGLAERELHYWTTPHDLSLSHAGSLFGYPVEIPVDGAQLRAALRRAHSVSGCTIVEVRLDGAAPRDEMARVRRSVASALGPWLADEAQSGST